MIDRLRWQTASDIGLRLRNEDAVAVRHGVTGNARGDHPFAVLCDGIGGHPNGEVAAWTATAAFSESYLQHTARNPQESIAERLEAALKAANQAIRKAIVNDRFLSGMGTTLTAAAVTDKGLEWISVGDSPLYLVTARGAMRQVNERHNAPWNGHELTSALLGRPLQKVCRSKKPTKLRTGQTLIVASDGIDTLAATEVVKATRERAALAAELVGQTMNTGRGNQDNVTVATLRTSEMPYGTHAERKAIGFRAGVDIEVSVDGWPLDWWRSLEVSDHSPTGPEWGYRGSGPMQLALALLMAVTDDESARTHHGRFKDEVVAGLPREGWELPLKDIANWLERQPPQG